MPGTASLVQQESTTTGTGNMALTTVVGRQELSVISEATFFYAVLHATIDEWEIGITGLLSGELDRASATIIASSNVVSGVAELVNFSAGTKVVISDVPQEYQPAWYKQDAEPTDPRRWDVWVRTTDYAVFLYAYDGNSTQWVQIGGGTGGAATPFVDSNGNEWLDVSATASAVNHVQITNSATGNDVKINAAGDDTNIDLQLDGKGTGGVAIGSVAANGQGTITSENGHYYGAYRLGEGVVLEYAEIGTSSPSSVAFALASYGSQYKRFRVEFWDVFNDGTATTGTTHENYCEVGTGPTATPTWITGTAAATNDYYYSGIRIRSSNGTANAFINFKNNAAQNGFYVNRGTRDVNSYASAFQIDIHAGQAGDDWEKPNKAFNQGAWYGDNTLISWSTRIGQDTDKDITHFRVLMDNAGFASRVRYRLIGFIDE